MFRKLKLLGYSIDINGLIGMDMNRDIGTVDAAYCPRNRRVGGHFGAGFPDVRPVRALQ